jgi:hypothetical protein
MLYHTLDNRATIFLLNQGLSAKCREFGTKPPFVIPSAAKNLVVQHLNTTFLLAWTVPCAMEKGSTCLESDILSAAKNDKGRLLLAYLLQFADIPQYNCSQE